MTFVPLPEFNQDGDLPVAVYKVTLEEVLQRFGSNNPERRVLGNRLEHIFSLAVRTRQLAHFIVFGSFITSKETPGDIDIFLIMEDTFEVNQIAGEARNIFNHMTAQNHLGASLFWIRRLAALGGEEEAIKHWQIKRDGKKRGIIEIIYDSQ